MEVSAPAPLREAKQSTHSCTRQADGKHTYLRHPELFKDVKEVWGAGQQPVRNVYASIGAFTVNLVLYSVVEVWAWARAEERLEDRSRCAWDTEERRPSHADKRKALQRLILREEIRAAVRRGAEPEEFSDWAIRLLDLAA